MSRRSERLAKATTTSGRELCSGKSVNDQTDDDGLPPAEDAELELGSVNAEEDSEYENSKKKTGSTGKRKRAQRKSVPGQPSTKKMRGKRGSLKDLLDMNVDVLYEIFGCLDPIDLLHLAWTCKMTRGFLMSKSSKLLWKAARSNIPGLPECPEDLSEPQYANLAFGKSCHFCLRNLSNVKVVWTARLRICGKCMDGRFFPMSRRMHNGAPDMVDLRSLVPKVVSSGRRGKLQEYFYYSMDRQWEKDYVTAENKQEWLEKEISKQEEIQTHSLECEIWYDRYQDYLEGEKAELILSRAKVIEDLLGEMGWEDEITDIRNNGSSIAYEDLLVLVACQKDLTERVIQNLLPRLKKTMNDYKRNRLYRKLRDVLYNRIPVLKEIVNVYRSTIRPDAVALDIGDIFSHPEVLDLMVNSLDISDPTHLDPIRAKLPVIDRQLQLGIEDQLVKMVEASCGSEHGLDRHTLLTLATTTFQCNFCGVNVSDVIRHPRVLVHSCAIKKSTYVQRLSLASEFLILTDLTDQNPWNKFERVTFNAEAHKILHQVVVICGFDPATTSLARMEEADPIFECRACNDPHSGRFMMRWNVVPGHLKKEHKHFTLKESSVHLLPEEQAQSIRIRMIEDVARKQAHRTYSDMVCTRCRQKGNSVSLRTHISSEHGVSDPSKEVEDFVVDLDAPSILSTYYAWPPRNESENTGS